MGEEPPVNRQRVAYCLFCDDIRLEVGNKPSLMGCYSTDLGVAQPFPLLLPKMAVYLWIISDLSDPPLHMTITVILPDKVELIRLPVPLGVSPEIPNFMREGAERIVLTYYFPMTPFPLPCEGMIEVWIETEREKLRAGRLWVHEVTAAQLQPAYTMTVVNDPPTA